MHVFPPSVTCLKVKFNMLPEKLLVNNLISYVLGIMGESSIQENFYYTVWGLEDI